MGFISLVPYLALRQSLIGASTFRLCAVNVPNALSQLRYSDPIFYHA
jgi:hypothetical protein